jgi:hypothetical protein
MFLETVVVGQSLATNVVHLTRLVLRPASLSVCLFLNDSGNFVILLRALCNFCDGLCQADRIVSTN